MLDAGELPPAADSPLQIAGRVLAPVAEGSRAVPGPSRLSCPPSGKPDNF